MEFRMNVRRIAPQHNDAIRQNHRFFNIVSNDKNRARRYFLVQPQLEQLAAQRFCGQHVQRGKWLVHEQYFRLNHQRPRHSHPLLHAARQFLRIRRLESIQSRPHQ